jgi:hypothetical protein
MVLVYAHRADSPFHAIAAPLLRSLAENATPWLMPWHCLIEFFGVVTRRKLFAFPSTPGEAVRQIEAWLGSPSIVLGVPRPSYWPRMRELIATAEVSGPFIHDAHVAAICLDYGARELITGDSQMRRFSGLKCRDPFARSPAR